MCTCSVEKKSVKMSAKDKFDGVYRAFIQGKITEEVAAKRLKLDVNSFCEYAKSGYLKASKGVIYEAIGLYLSNEFTVKEAAEKLNIQMATFLSYVRRFGGAKKKGHITLKREDFEPIYIEYKLGNISIEEAAEKLNVCATTFRQYLRYENKYRS